MKCGSAPVGEFDDDRLAQEFAGRSNALDAAVVCFVRDLIETERWRGDGIRSPEHWLTLRLGCGRSRAATLVAVARRVDEFPLVGDRFRQGLLSLDQMRVIVDGAPSWGDLYLRELAEHATVSQLRRIVAVEFPAGVVSEVDVADDESLDVEDNDPSPRTGGDLAGRLSFAWASDGRLRGSFDLATDSGALFEAALTEARDAQYRDADVAVSWADALGTVAARSLDSSAPQRRRRFRVMVHVNVDQPLARLANGVALPESVRDYLCCDADAKPVWERDGRPVGYGRTQRSIPSDLRALIIRRDHGCVVAGCGDRFVDIHHIWHWKDGGPTDTWNLASLCRHHHRSLHSGQIAISGNPDDGSLEVVDSRGRQLRGPRPLPPDAPEPPPARQFRSPTGERLDTRCLQPWKPPERCNLNPRERALHIAHVRRRRVLGSPQTRPLA